MPLFVPPSTLGSATITTNSASAVGLTVTPAAGQTADMLDIDASKSTHTNPATIGFVNTVAGTAARVGNVYAGVLYDGLQMGNAQSTQLVGYYGLVLQGNAQQNVPGPAFFGAFGDRAVHIPITNATDIGLVIKAAPSQSGDLQEWIGPTGTVLAKVDNIGNFTTTNSIWSTGNVSVIGGGTHGVSAPNYYDPNQSGPYLSMGATAITVLPRSISQIPMIVQGFAGQTADLQQWQSSATTPIAKVDASGNFTTAGGVTTAYASKAANYTMTASDSVIVAAAASLVITLPSAAAVSAGRVYTIKNNNQTTTTIKTSAAGQTIDGTDYSTTGYALNTAYGVVRLVSNGTAAWFTI